MSWIPPEHHPSTELRDHLPPERWREAIEEIRDRHGLGPAPATPFATGSDVVWGVGEWVVKMTAPLWRDESEAEARCLALVDGRLPVRTPRLAAAGQLAGWPYVVMSRVPGRALGDVWPALDARERRRLAAELGGMTREMHALEPGEGHGDWVAWWLDCRSRVVERQARTGAPREWIDGIEPFLESVGELESSGRVLLHTELLGEHVLVEERGGRWHLCAAIDFADGRIGPPDYEFTAPVEFVFRGEAGVLREFLLEYGIAASELAPERSERMLAWALCHRFGSLERMRKAVEPARPAGLRELARLLFRVD